MKLKFSKAVLLSSLYWYRGTTNTSPTVTPRVYNVNGQLIGSGIGLSEATRVVGWYRVDFSAPVKLEANAEYLIGFHFLNGVPIGSGNTPTPTVFQISEGLSLTYNSMYSGTTDIMPTTVNNNVLLSIGFDYITYSNKFLISSEDKYYSLFAKESVNQIPKMTTNNLPSGEVLSSSTYATASEWKVFDRDLTTFWQTNSIISNQWLRYKFVSPINITSYTMTNDSITLAPKNFKLQGSNDDQTYIDLDIRTNITDWIAGSKKYSLLQINQLLFIIDFLLTQITEDQALESMSLSY